MSWVGGISCESFEGYDKVPEVKLAVLRRVIAKVTREIDNAQHCKEGKSADTAVAELAKLMGKPEPDKVVVGESPCLNPSSLKGPETILLPTVEFSCPPALSLRDEVIKSMKTL